MAIAHKLHSKEINHLRKKFQIIDTGNTGNNNLFFYSVDPLNFIENTHHLSLLFFFQKFS